MNAPVSVDAASPETISAEELDRRFDEGEDISAYFDWSAAQQPALEAKRVNLEFPAWMVRSLDIQARKRGVTRQALIKMWLADRLEAAVKDTAAP
jgi:hypothetical protein